MSGPQEPSRAGPATERLARGLAVLDPAVQQRVAACREVAKRERVAAFFVGGLVRDLLLGRPTRDLDIVVEGDGPHFAATLAADLGGRLRRHPRFVTAEVQLPGGEVLDVATARAESYSAPAVLPDVRPASLEEDLARRDFSVNAMAMPVEATPPRLVDPLGGLRDLEGRTLRVLHGRSFFDDPTRAFRGARFERRLGFLMDPGTLSLLREALAEGALDRLSGSRMRAELMLAADEVGIEVEVLRRLGEVGLLAGIHPALTWGGDREARLASALAAARALESQATGGALGSQWRLLLLALVADLEPAAREGVARRLALVGEERRLAVEEPARIERARRSLTSEGAAPHSVAAVLDGLPAEALPWLAGEGGPLRAWVERYLREMKPLSLSLRAADLLARGIPAGPPLGRALRAVREARLDGVIGPDGELDFALEFLRGEEPK